MARTVLVRSNSRDAGRGSVGAMKRLPQAGPLGWCRRGSPGSASERPYDTLTAVERLRKRQGGRSESLPISVPSAVPLGGEAGRFWALAADQKGEAIWPFQPEVAGDRGRAAPNLFAACPCAGRSVGPSRLLALAPRHPPRLTRKGVCQQQR